MGYNTIPCNPYPISTEELNKGNNDALNTRVTELESSVSDLDSDKANKVDIATEFSDLTNYNAGDLVYYDGALYEFQVDHTAGAWETSEVIQKDLSDIVTTLKSGLNNGEVDTTSVQDVRFVKIGRIVTMVTEVWHQGFTVPVGFRPWAVTYLPARVSAGAGTSAAIGYIRVGTDGALTIPDNTDFVGSVSWVTA